MASRERRKTAGRRMTSLVGKALEEDDAFWGHETWAEDEDSGNESFHESDEDSDLQKDEFDSDFNDSESDHDEEERAAGMAEEAELRKIERSSKQRSNNYVDIAKAGRELMQKKKGKGRKRVMGDGINAGIVLNFPAAEAAGNLLPEQQASQTVATPPKYHAKQKPHASSPVSLASSRRRRSHFSPRQLRENRSTAPTEFRVGSQAKSTKKNKRKRYVQEELLLEAVNETEPQNERWLLARKRVQDLVEKDKDAMSLRDAAGTKIIEKYHSRRGCLITLTFPEMDSVPELLTRQTSKLNKPSPTYCAVTGMRAKYRDPLTSLGYYDAAAFKELRRRYNAGEPLESNSHLQETDVEMRKQLVETAENGSEGPEFPSDDAGTWNEKQRTNFVGQENSFEERSAILTPVTSSAESMLPVVVKERAKASEFHWMSKNSGSVRTTPCSLSDSPVGRRSRRVWKPSSKLLQNIVTEDRKLAAAAGALTIRVGSCDEPNSCSSAAEDMGGSNPVGHASSPGRCHVQDDDALRSAAGNADFSTKSQVNVTKVDRMPSDLAEAKDSSPPSQNWDVKSERKSQSKVRQVDGMPSTSEAPPRLESSSSVTLEFQTQDSSPVRAQDANPSGTSHCNAVEIDQKPSTPEAPQVNEGCSTAVEIGDHTNLKQARDTDRSRRCESKVAKSDRLPSTSKSTLVCGSSSMTLEEQAQHDAPSSIIRDAGKTQSKVDEMLLTSEAPPLVSTSADATSAIQTEHDTSLPDQDADASANSQRKSVKMDEKPSTLENPTVREGSNMSLEAGDKKEACPVLTQNSSSLGKSQSKGAKVNIATSDRPRGCEDARPTMELKDCNSGTSNLSRSGRSQKVSGSSPTDSHDKLPTEGTAADATACVDSQDDISFQIADLPANSVGANMNGITADSPAQALGSARQSNIAATGLKRFPDACTTRSTASAKHEKLISGSEPVYVVPPESLDDYGDTREQNRREPRYITQSELIMEAIHTYSRRQEERERSLSQGD